MKALTTRDLDAILYSNAITAKTFAGTYPSCVQPSPKRGRYSFITNTQSHDKTGQHWNAWFINYDNVIYFDSFGRCPRNHTLPKYYRNFIRRFKKVDWVKTRVQGQDSKACGYFCVHFIYLLSVGFNTRDFLNEYTSDFIKNDEIVLDIVSSIT